MMTPTLIRAGFDTVEYSVFGKVPEDFLCLLREVKQQAAKTRKPWPINYKGTGLFVQPHGARGQFAYIVSTGLYGATIRFREIGSRDPFCAHITLSAYGLATKGIKKLKSECDDLFRLVGAVCNAEKTCISRMDYALDFFAPGIVVEANKFVTHARRNKTEEIERNSIGDHVNYLRIGKMPGAQLCIYNKGRQITQKSDLIWNDAFRLALRNFNLDAEINDLWRVELRLGKIAIDKFESNRQWNNVLAKASTAFLQSSDQISWRVGTHDSNRSRWPLHPIWPIVQSHLANEFEAFEPIEISPATKRQMAEDYVSGLEAQCEGLVLTIAAVYDVEAEHIGEFVTSHFSKIGDRLTARADLEDQLQARKARQILVFGS